MIHFEVFNYQVINKIATCEVEYPSQFLQAGISNDLSSDQLLLPLLQFPFSLGF